MVSKLIIAAQFIQAFFIIWVVERWTDNKRDVVASSAWYKTCGNTCRQIFTLSTQTFTTSGVIQATVKNITGGFTPLWANSSCTTPIVFNVC